MKIMKGMMILDFMMQTSMEHLQFAPVVTGIVALYLQVRPTATSRDVKNWIKDNGTLLPQSIDANSGDGWWSPYGDDTDTAYWTGQYNLRGADSRVLYNPYANDDEDFNRKCGI